MRHWGVRLLMLVSALGTFALLLVELLLLFMAISYAVALVNRRFGPRNIKGWMASGRVPDQVRGLALGAFTPFWPRSRSPEVANMLEAGGDFRTTVTYLVASPLLTPVIAGGIWLIFDWPLAVTYTAIMIIWSLVAPHIWTTLGMEH